VVRKVDTPQEPGQVLKILHVPYTYRPDSIGGTEIYVEALALELQSKYGARSIICAPAGESSAYSVKSIEVRRFAVQGAGFSVSYVYGSGDPTAAANFARIVQSEEPDVVHMHALTAAASMLVAEEVKLRGLPLVFTYHTPTVTCQRGNLLRWGHIPCDGRMLVARCASCTLHGRGLSRVASTLVGHLPVAAGRALAHRGLSGSYWTALRMSELTEQHHSMVRRVMELADAIVAPSQWVIDLLKLNGVPAEKLVLSRQGLSFPRVPPRTRTPASDARLRVAFFGRLHPTKGIHVLAEAMSLIPDAPVDLDIFAIPESSAASDYQRRILDAAAKDARIRLRDPVESDGVVATMSEYDLIAIPSQWLETGPLVVLEAFAAGIPVIGSDLGGIAERVQPGINGLVVPAGSAEAWAQALARLAKNRDELEAMRRNVTAPRSMGEVATEMHDLYLALGARAGH
jgi:glycosyltransferase involved in cell wall biosynthesis